MMDVAADESKIPCDERRQESTKTKRNADPKVVLVASGMDDEMESLAVSLAIDAIAVFCNEKMKIANYIASKFEAKYGAPWHCIASDGHMRFYVRYDADDHIFFAVNGITIFLFRLHTSKSRPLITRLHRRLSDASTKVESPRDDVHVISTGMQLRMQHYALRLTDDAVVEYPNEKMIIAHYITTRFAAQYGGNWHCVVSDGRLGYEVRHHSEDHIFFSVGSLTVLLFREEDVKNATMKSSLLKPRKLSTSMQLPTKIISSCMDMEMQQFAVTVAVQGIEMKFADEKMQIARLLMRHFDERFGAPWHCIVGDQPLGFYVRYDQQNYLYFIVEPLTILLFKHQKEKLLSEETSEETKGAALMEGEGDANKEVCVIDSGLDKSMDEKATLFAREAVNRFPNERMLSAHYIMRRLESQYGPPWHCVVSGGPLGYSTHQVMESGDEIVLAPSDDLPTTTPSATATAAEKPPEAAALAKEGKDELPQPNALHEGIAGSYELPGDGVPLKGSPQEPAPETSSPPEPAPQYEHDPAKEPEREPHMPLDEADYDPYPYPSEPAAVPEGPETENENQVPSNEREVPEPQEPPKSEPQQHDAAKPEADHPTQQKSCHSTQPEPEYPVQSEPFHPLKPEPRYPAKPEPQYPLQPEADKPTQHEPQYPTLPQPNHLNQPEPHQPSHPEPPYPTQPEPHSVHPDSRNHQHDPQPQPMSPPSYHPQPQPDPFRDNVPLPIQPENVQVIATGMNAEMQQYAVDLAQEAIANSPSDMMNIAQHLMTHFEQKYGSPWHCVVSDGRLGFYVRYDPAGHIYFAVGSTIIFLFRNQNS